jgi:HTH-type transcriptional regulator / antitoxin HigA
MSTVQIERALEAWPRVRPAIYLPRNQREYRQLVKFLDRLIDKVGEDENHPLASMMEIIGVLVEKYEEEHVAELV